MRQIKLLCHPLQKDGSHETYSCCEDFSPSAFGSRSGGLPDSLLLRLYSLPTISLANPGGQVNTTSDVISLPIPATASGTDTLSYTATGLPAGLDIDPNTGVITGMDDAFNANSGVTYPVVITLTDEYGQTQSQSFTWQFNTAASVVSAGVANGAGNVALLGANGAGFPASGQHPTTEARSDNFSVDGFWQNVEKLPGGQAAENWLASQNGQVAWGWTLSVTHGRFETQANSSIVPVVHIPWQNDEASAAIAFVVNVTQSWVIGFAAYSKIPTNGSPADWQEYIKARTKATGQVAVTGAELLLSGLSIVNEGTDWIVTINDVATAKTPGQAAIASIGLLPFISNSSVKLLSKAGNVLLDISSKQRLLIKNFLDAYATLGLGTYKSFNVVQRAARNGTTAIVLQRSIQFSKENVISLIGGKIDAATKKFVPGPSRSPYAINPRTRKYEVVELHHVDQLSEADGVLAEILQTENKNGNLLHPGAVNVVHDAQYNALRASHWRMRLQEAIDNGEVPLTVLQDPAVLPKLKASGFQLPF